MTAPAPKDAMREALAKQVYCACALTEDEAFRVADFIIADREKRERVLLLGIDSALRSLRHDPERKAFAREYLESAVREHGALDAPPQRTVEEIAADVNRAAQSFGLHDSTDFVMIPRSLRDELAAALDRAKRKGV